MFRTLLCAAVSTVVCHAQPVRAPRAQALINALMAKHKEMQTIGLHVTPPGWTDNLNIACSKPGKVGKLSADLDLGVIRTGTPSLRRTEKGAFDMGLPIADREGRALGMVVIVIPQSFTNDTETAKRRAAAIRDELQAQVGSLEELLQGAVLVKSLAAMVAQTPLPGITGGFGHFALDAAHDRVFLAAEDNHSIEVFTLAGEHARSVKVVQTPHAIAYDAERNAILVADGGDSSCAVLDAADLRPIKRIPLPEGPDAGVYDTASRLFYIGTRGGIGIVSAESLTVVGRIPVASDDVKGMAIDAASGRLFVNLRDKEQVAVISTANRKVEYLWQLPGVHANTAMAFDKHRQQLLVAGRNPGRFAVLDANSGKLLQVVDAAEGADDLWFDEERRRVYITGVGGVSIFAQAGDGHYLLNSQFNAMKSKTSIYIPGKKLLFAVHAASEEDGAGLQVYLIR